MAERAELRPAGLLDEARLLIRLLRVSVRAQMEYRGSFLMLVVGHGLITSVEFLGLLVVFDRFGQIEGWRLPEVALLYGMVNVSFAAAEAAASGFDHFGDEVKSGDFDRTLLRPRATALQLAGKQLRLRPFGRMLQGGAVLLWAAGAAGVAWTPERLGLLLAGLVGGAALFYALLVLQATLAFFTVESLEFMNAFTYGGVEATQYPVTIYGPYFRRFLIYVLPLACVNYFPAVALLGRPEPLGFPAAMSWGAPLVGPAFLLASLGLWTLGVRRYTSTGS